MKCIINGNVACVSTDIVFADLKKAAAKYPVQIKGGEKGDKVLFSARLGQQGMKNIVTEEGAIFTYANGEGKACFNIGPADCGLDDSGRFTAEVIADKFGPGLQALKTHETALKAAVEQALADREALLGLVSIG